MEVKYNDKVEDFEIKIGDNTFFVPVRKIFELTDQLENPSDPTILKISDDKKIHISKNDALFLKGIIFDSMYKNRLKDMILNEKDMLRSPQRPFLLRGAMEITNHLKKKWEKLGNFISINLIDVFSPKTEYECPKEFIEENDLFSIGYFEAFETAIKIANKNENKINFFLMRTERHTFLLIKIRNNLFMFDSIGQRYGKLKTNLNVKEDGYLKLNEIAYTNIFLKYLKENKDAKLYFNINCLQQDTTNCFTFSTVFLDLFCERVATYIEKENVLNHFDEYLKKFFPVQLEENKQVFHEGLLDVLESAIKAIPDNEKTFETSKRLALPPELLATAQLNNLLLEPVKRISDINFSNIIMPNGLSLEEMINQSNKLVAIRKKDGAMVEKVVNRRIADARIEQENYLLSIE